MAKHWAFASLPVRINCKATEHAILPHGNSPHICTNAHVFDMNMYVATSGCSGILQFPAQVPLGLWLAASACRLRLVAELSTHA